MKKLNLLMAACAAYTVFAGAASATPYCASTDQKKAVDAFYEKRPAAPLAIPGRQLKVPEEVVASAMPKGKTFGTAATPEKVKQVWASIDAWGKETMIHTVFTMGGQHVADFVTNVPITQPDDGSGFLDIYADDGAGVHGHIHLADVKSIYAVDIPGKEPGEHTRTITFYDKDGTAIVGVYATLGKKAFHQKAVEGFAKSFDLVKAMPQLCS